MLNDWDSKHPGRVASVFRAMQNVAPSQLADTGLFEFTGLEIDRSGDRAAYDFAEAKVGASSEEKLLQFVDAIDLQTLSR